MLVVCVCVYHWRSRNSGILTHLVQMDIKVPEFGVQVAEHPKKRTVDHDTNEVFLNSARKLASPHMENNIIAERSPNPKGEQVPHPLWKSLQSVKSKQSQESTLTKNIQQLVELEQSSQIAESVQSPIPLKSLRSPKLQSDNARLPATIQPTPVNPSDPMCLQYLNDHINDRRAYNSCAGR